MNYYEILGVNRDASQDEIAKAYREKSKANHPDLQHNDAAIEEATKKIKDINKAFEVLGDPRKRSEYDHISQRRPTAKPFSTFEDDFFSRFFGEGQEHEDVKGDDIVVQKTISLLEVLHGGEVEVSFNRKKLCPVCHGNKGIYETCAACHGSGRRLIQGQAMNVMISCGTCNQTGKVLKERCQTCGGTGLSDAGLETIMVAVPPGVESGMKFLFRGKGQPGQERPGDMYVVFHVLEHPFLRRLSNGDLLVKVPVTYTQLVFGDKVDVPTLESIATVTIPPASQPGTKLRLKGKGLPYRLGMNERALGDQYVELDLEVPAHMGERYQALLGQLSELESNNITPLRKDYLDRLEAYHGR